MNLRFTRIDKALSQVTILQRTANGWIVETRRASACVAGPRPLPNVIAARLIEYADYGFRVARKAKNPSRRG